MSYFGDRRGAANMAPLLMIVAFASMIGFLVWLGMISEGTEVAPMNEPEEEVDPLERGALRVTEAELRAPETLEGRTVRATGPVASRVGREAFFLDYSAAPFLVHMDSALVAERQAPPTGNVIVVGTLTPMTDSVITEWTDRGAISSGDRPVVEFATHFIEAAIVRPNEDAAAEDTTGAAGDTAQAAGAAGEAGGG